MSTSHGYFKKLVRNLFYCILFITVIFSFLNCNSEKKLDNLKKITIAQAGDFFLYAPLYIAVDAGLFRKQGLDVSIVSTGGDEKTWAAVISGNASFGIADPTFVAVSEKRGVPGKVIASIVNGVPFWGITQKSEIKPFTNPKNLAGYTVGTFPSPSTAYALQKKMFQDSGLTPNIREGAFGTIISMLHAGQIDIALELEPNVSQEVSKGAKILYSMRNIYGNFAITGLTTTPELLKKNPDLVQKVVCGLQQALDFLRSQKSIALEILAKRFPEIERKIAERALERVINEEIIPQFLTINEDAWDKAIKLRIEIGDIEKANVMSVYVNNTFAEWAKINCHSINEK